MNLCAMVACYVVFIFFPLLGVNTTALSPMKKLQLKKLGYPSLDKDDKSRGKDGAYKMLCVYHYYIDDKRLSKLFC